MKSNKWVQKFHTDDASLPRSGWFVWLAEIEQDNFDQQHDWIDILNGIASFN